jgi:hypothetical protein
MTCLNVEIYLKSGITVRLDHVKTFELDSNKLVWSQCPASLRILNSLEPSQIIGFLTLRDTSKNKCENANDNL